MCGRITLACEIDEIAAAFSLGESVAALALPDGPRWNISPGGPVAAVLRDIAAGQRMIRLLRWGLLPPWEKDPATARGLVNARSETAAVKPAFRGSLAKRRCLVPVSGFYEWQARDRRKQPWHFRAADQPCFGLAGIWRSRPDPDGPGELASLAILTTEANEIMAPVHHRMPVIVAPRDQDRWLDPQRREADELADILRPWDAGRLEAWPVDPAVGDARAEGPGCILPWTFGADDTGDESQGRLF